MNDIATKRKSRRFLLVVLVLLLLSKHSFWIGLFLRIFLAWLLPWCMDHSTTVMYTDIDYHVFTDAAEHIQNGGSPYDRTTYRYTPFLAALLAQLPAQRISSRYLFCIADAICGWMILKLRQNQRQRQRQQQQQQQQQQQTTQSTQREEKENNDNDNNNSAEDERGVLSSFVVDNTSLVDALWWLYNPLAINICTRGSSESLQVLLPVLITVWITTNYTTTTNNNNNNNNDQHNSKKQASSRLLVAAFVAGLWHGIAIHAKLYPIIYTLSFMTAFTTTTTTTTVTTTATTTTTTTEPTSTEHHYYYYHNNNKPRSSITTGILRFVGYWIQHLFTPAPLLFGIVTVLTFTTLTYVSVLWYGKIALEEGLLYHFSRVDHRHNYSMHWYWIYLARGASTTTTTTTTITRNGVAPRFFFFFPLSMKWMGRLLLFPQMILLAYSSLHIAPYNLTLALFVQTFLFVTHNKVITAQYFTWYLCLLPLCSDAFQWKNNNNNHNRRRLVKALGILVLSIVCWLASAYCLEMQGMAVHILVWMASVFFFVANVNLLGALLQSVNNHQKSRVIQSNTDMKQKKE